MLIEKHPSDCWHLVYYHFLPTALIVLVTYAVIILSFRLLMRRGRGRKRGPEEVGGLNRRQRRQGRAMRRRKGR